MAPAAPAIAVVVPAYNAARFLAATLESVLAQHETRWECMIVDDGSSDGTAQIAFAFCALDARFRLFQQANQGASAARNAGFRRTSAPYVTFMDSDDVWAPGALAVLLERLQAHPEAVGSHGLAEFIDAGGQPIHPGVYPAMGRMRLGREGRRLVRWPPSRPTDFDVLINGNVLFPPGLLLARRSTYESAGPFDESLNGPEDWDMLIRLSRYGPLEFVDEVLLRYRRHDHNLGAGTTVAHQAWLVRCKAFHSPENSPEQRRAAKSGWRAYQIYLAHDARRAIGSALRRREIRSAAKDIARLGAFLVRYVRGWPHPRVKSAPLRW